MVRVKGVTSLVVWSLTIAACGGDAPVDPGTGGDAGSGTTAKSNPEFAADIQALFDTEGCTAFNCHGAAPSGGNGNLDLRSGDSYGQLVNVTASGEDIIRVIPNNPDGSYLVIKLEGRQSSGSRMPLALPALESSQIQLIKNWINNGAPNN